MDASSDHPVGDGTDPVDLGRRILAFVEEHAKVRADYEPASDDPSERFNGPDSAMLAWAGAALVAGEPSGPVASSFGSGCYRNHADRGLRRVHDDLVARANGLARGADLPRDDDAPAPSP